MYLMYAGSMDAGAVLAIGRRNGGDELVRGRREGRTMRACHFEGCWRWPGLVYGGMFRLTVLEVVDVAMRLVEANLSRDV